MDDPAALRGVSHLSLSVRDLDRSLTFYGDTLGLPVQQPPQDGEVFAGRQAILRVGRTGVSLQEHAGADGEAFDPRRCGLDHLAFDVGERDELERWVERLDAAGVEHSGVKDVLGWDHEMIELRDPDGIQLELFARGGGPRA